MLCHCCGAESGRIRKVEIPDPDEPSHIYYSLCMFCDLGLTKELQEKVLLPDIPNNVLEFPTSVGV